MMLRILIVDDEPLARTRLRAQLADLAAGEVVGEASTGREALALLQTLTPNLLLLDIRMPEMDGLEVARHAACLPQPPHIVFTTAYNEHALAAFEAHAIDYLLKPVRSERLRGALERARLLTAAQLRALSSNEGPRAHLSAYIKGNLRIVPLGDVRFLRADEGYVTVRHAQGEIVVDDSLKSLEEEFGELFLRIHRNTLVAPAHVAGLTRDALGNGTIRFRDIPEQLPVSRRLLSEVRRRLRALTSAGD